MKEKIMMNGMEQYPKISIVTISYNAENEIEQTMLSVLNQSYENLEYLIIDGASNDNTVRIAQRVKDKYPNREVLIISEPDKGLYDAMNKGIKKATGLWCAFMNCGDQYVDNQVIESLAETGSFNHSYKIVYGNTILVKEDGTIRIHKTADEKLLNDVIHKYQPYCHQSAFFSLYNKNDCLFDTQYKIGADYDICCRIYKKYGAESFCYIDQVVAQYKAYEGVSTTNVRRLKKEHILVKIRNRMSTIIIIRNSLKYFCDYIIWKK